MMISDPQVLLGRAHPVRHSESGSSLLIEKSCSISGTNAASGGSGMNSTCCGVGCRQ